jgi:Flp pilus assembly pilin Flp
MRWVAKSLETLTEDTRGVTAIEYAVVAGATVVAVAATVPPIGLWLASAFLQVNGAF